MHLGEYIIRHATPIDLFIVKKFYADNAHAYNAARSDDLLLNTIQQNRKMLILQGPSGEVLGATAVFDLLDGRFREAGATRITLNGFRIQRIFHHLRAVHEHVMDHDYEAYFSTVVVSNKQSINNLEAVGFEMWDAPAPDLVRYKKALAEAQGRTSQIAYYRLPEKKLTVFAREILSMIDNGTLTRESRTTPGATESIELKLDVEIARYHRPVLERLANGLPIHD